MTQKEEIEFKKQNKDCYIPNDFSIVYYEYANLPAYLRRWCVFKENLTKHDSSSKKDCSTCLRMMKWCIFRKKGLKKGNCESYKRSPS